MSSFFRFLFYLFIIPNIFALITSKPIKHKPLEYPCLPPHHSYPFCNTSLPVKTRAQSLISHLTLSEKVHQLANAAAKIPRLGIPAYQWWSESLHGIATNGKGINFSIGPIFHTVSVPQIVVLAASFNRSLWFKTASAIGVEARAMHNVGQAGLTFWAPNINILRDPRWGRGQETPGEDPMVVSAFGVEYVRGFQHENPKVDETRSNGLMLSACCKHLSAYDLDNWKNYTRYNFNAVITEQDLQDTYHPPFRSCIQQGKASCLMCSYNSINGVPACANKELLQKARRDWGFKGYITADCDAVSSIYETQNYTKTREDAVALALKAGTDIDCKDFMVNYTQSAIEQGKVQEEDVNRALLHLFLVQLRVGLFDGDPTKGPFGKLGPKDVCTAEHKTLALEAARQGIVLLKNDKKFLPRDRNVNSSLAVIGPLANVTALLRGTYRGVSCNPISIFEGLETYAKNITYVAGCLDVRCNSTHGFQEAVSIAKEADSVIVVAGLDKSQEYEYQDRNNLLLPGYQMALVTRIADELFRYNKKPLVLVLVGGGPVDVSFADGDPRIASILWIGYPGEAGGKALAEIIFGDYNPGGRLPFTWYPEEFTRVPMTDMNMRGDPSRGYPGRTYRFYMGDSLYEFGYGLSFTNYTYKLLSVPKKLTLSGPIIAETEKRLDYYIHVDEVASCDSLKFNVQISVMNHGDMDGSNIVLLFSRFPKNFTGAPIKQLVGFDRVQTSPNRSTETSLLVDPCKHLSFADEHGKIILPLGNHTLVLEDLEHIVSIEG